MSTCRYGLGSCQGWWACLSTELSVRVACLLQVVHVGSRGLPALLEEPEAAASPLLCLTQSGPPSFLQPVTVQLPLPPGITGERQRHVSLDFWPRGGQRCSEGEPCQGGLSLRPLPPQA